MTPNDLITRLGQHLTTLGDGRECRSPNERATYEDSHRRASRLLSALRNLPADLAKLEQRLADLDAERAEVVAKRTEIEEALVAAPDATTIRDGRERDKEADRQHQLRRTLERLHDGSLLRAPDCCYRPLAYLDRRIAELTDARDRAQRALDGTVAQAEALLAETSVPSATTR